MMKRIIGLSSITLLLLTGCGLEEYVGGKNNDLNNEKNYVEEDYDSEYYGVKADDYEFDEDEANDYIEESYNYIPPYQDPDISEFDENNKEQKWGKNADHDPELPGILNFKGEEFYNTVEYSRSDVWYNGSNESDDWTEEEILKFYKRALEYHIKSLNHFMAMTNEFIENTHLRPSERWMQDYLGFFDQLNPDNLYGDIDVSVEGITRFTKEGTKTNDDFYYLGKEIEDVYIHTYLASDKWKYSIPARDDYLFTEGMMEYENLVNSMNEVKKEIEGIRQKGYHMEIVEGLDEFLEENKEFIN